MADPLNVTHWPVYVNPVSGGALAKLKNRLDIMEREIAHLRTAVIDMRNGIKRGDSRLLTGGVMNSRNWALSVVMSHCYVQTILGEGAPGSSGFKGQGMMTPLPQYQSETLFQRAGKIGAAEGFRDRKA
jgi:hypothetical protein